MVSSQSMALESVINSASKSNFHFLNAQACERAQSYTGGRARAQTLRCVPIISQSSYELRRVRATMAN